MEASSEQQQPRGGFGRNLGSRRRREGCRNRRARCDFPLVMHQVRRWKELCWTNSCPRCMWVGFVKDLFTSETDFWVEAVAVVGLSCLLQLGGRVSSRWTLIGAKIFAPSLSMYCCYLSQQLQCFKFANPVHVLCLVLIEVETPEHKTHGKHESHVQNRILLVLLENQMQLN